MLLTTPSIAALLLSSSLIYAQEDVAVDGSIVYTKTTELQGIETYTVSNTIHYSYVDTTYWSQISTIHPGDEGSGPAPDYTYTSGSVVFVLMTEQIPTSPYISDDGTWSYIHVTYEITLDTATTLIDTNDVSIVPDTTAFQASTPSLNLATTMTNPQAPLITAAQSENQSSPPNGLIAGCIIGGIAFIVIVLLTGWIIYLQRRMDSKTRSSTQSNIVPVNQNQRFDRQMRLNGSLPAYQSEIAYRPTGISQVGLQNQEPNTVRSPLEPHYARKIELSA